MINFIKQLISSFNKGFTQVKDKLALEKNQNGTKINADKIVFFCLFIFIGTSAQKSNTGIANALPDWQKDTFGYAKQIIPKKIKPHNSDEIIPITVKEAYITKVDRDPAVLVICKVIRDDKETSSLTYFFINPKTNQPLSEFQAFVSVKGCDFSIPAFVIRDINGDQKDDFIFLELYNDKCSGDYWIISNFHQIKPKTLKGEVDYYLKLRNDMTINRKVKINEIGQLQKKLESAVSELFDNK